MKFFNFKNLLHKDSHLEVKKEAPLAETEVTFIDENNGANDVYEGEESQSFESSEEDDFSEDNVNYLYSNVYLAKRICLDDLQGASSS